MPLLTHGTNRTSSDLAQRSLSIDVRDSVHIRGSKNIHYIACYLCTSVEYTDLTLPTGIDIQHCELHEDRVFLL